MLTRVALVVGVLNLSISIVTWFAMVPHPTASVRCEKSDDSYATFGIVFKSVSPTVLIVS
jgi:hypothetical protein